MTRAEPTQGVDAFGNVIEIGDTVAYWTRNVSTRAPGLVLARVCSFTAAGTPRVSDLQARGHAPYSGPRVRSAEHVVPAAHVVRYGVPGA